jgi:hypothetical protein
MRKRTKRKVYESTNPVEIAIAGARITDEARLQFLRDIENGSLAAFRGGSATKDDWHKINTVVRLAESMAAANIGAEVMVPAKIAEMHLLEAYERYERIGKMGSTGLGLQSFQDILEYHELQRTAVSRSVYESHINSVRNKITSKSPKIKFL